MLTTETKEYRITYKDPDTGTNKTITETFTSARGITAKEFAEDYAYMLADKGQYTVEEVTR